jgi:MbeD/MobD like
MSKGSQNRPRSVEEMVGAMSAQLSDILEQLHKVNQRLDNQEERFTALETMLSATQKENVFLKEQLVNLDHEVKQLKTKINDVEMHQRSFNVRIFNVPLDGDVNDTRNVAQQVYNRILKPILEGAVSKGRLSSVPAVDQLLETAHILPGKEGKPKPIICRFFNRFHRMLVLQLKKEFAPCGSATNAARGPPLLFPIYEDVTKDVFQLMRALSSHNLIDSCWVAGGIIRIRKVDSSVIQKVYNIYDTVDTIVESLK